VRRLPSGRFECVLDDENWARGEDEEEAIVGLCVKTGMKHWNTPLVAPMKHVVQYSGGLCSFWAAHRVIAKHGKENVTLLFADTMMEDEDLYRFNVDAEKFLGVTITRIADGRTPWDVMRDERVIGRSGLDVCSRILKRELLDKWRFSNTTPDSSMFYLGLDWTEGHRMNGDAQRDGMVKKFAPWTVKAPMMDEPIWDKCRMMKELAAIGIKLPHLYTLGFPHNNCGGFCIKAGQAHFAQLLRLMPERYAFHESKEQEMRAIVGDYSVMNDRRGGGGKKVMTLETFRKRVEAGEDFDRHDWGGCGCATT
jgi:hypothetical protein